MWKVWLATVLNFFLPGLGYLLLGGPRRLLGIPWLIGVIGLTYVETSIQSLDSGLYWTMFVSVLIMNTAFAIDAYRDGRALVAAS